MSLGPPSSLRDGYLEELGFLVAGERGGIDSCWAHLLRRDSNTTSQYERTVCQGDAQGRSITLLAWTVNIVNTYSAIGPLGDAYQHDPERCL